MSLIICPSCKTPSQPGSIFCDNCGFDLRTVTPSSAQQQAFTPVNNGEVIRINIPALTEERRKELVKQVKQEGEIAKVSIRNARREGNDELKRMQKSGLPEDEAKVGEHDIQKSTDDYVIKVDKVVEGKDKEIMTV